jgi:hypothetical protein
MFLLKLGQEGLNWPVPDVWYEHRLNMELDLQSLCGLHVHSCTTWLKPCTPPAFGLIFEGALGQTKVDDIYCDPLAVNKCTYRLSGLDCTIQLLHQADLQKLPISLKWLWVRLFIRFENAFYLSF